MLSPCTWWVFLVPLHLFTRTRHKSSDAEVSGSNPGSVVHELYELGPATWPLCSRLHIYNMEIKQGYLLHRVIIVCRYKALNTWHGSRWYHYKLQTSTFHLFPWVFFFFFLQHVPSTCFSKALPSLFISFHYRNINKKVQFEEELIGREKNYYFTKSFTRKRLEQVRALASILTKNNSSWKHFGYLGLVILYWWLMQNQNKNHWPVLWYNLVERPLKLVILQHVLYEPINKNPQNGAKINMTAAKSRINHAELFNPD